MIYGLLLGLSRNMATIKFSKKLSNGYVTGCNLEVLPMLHCRQIPCGNLCAMNADCTSFNLRQTGANKCNCELQSFSSTPWAPSAQVAEHGSSHWECG